MNKVDRYLEWVSNIDFNSLLSFVEIKDFILFIRFVLVHVDFGVNVIVMTNKIHEIEKIEEEGSNIENRLFIILSFFRKLVYLMFL